MPGPFRTIRHAGHAHWLTETERSQEEAYEALRHTLAPVLRRMMSTIAFAGVQNVPTRGPAILVSNHRSTLDPFLIALGLERHVHFVADTWLGQVAIARWLSSVGVLFLPCDEHRSEGLLKAGAQALNEGQLLGIFPEGMANFLDPGAPRHVSEFHTAFARLWWSVRDLGVPIVPVAVVGSENEWHVRLPGRIFGRLDPRHGDFGDRPVWGNFYASALVRFGRPLALPRPRDEARTIETIVRASRESILELMDGCRY